MAFLDRDMPQLGLDWRRVLLGIVAAPIVPSLLFGATNGGPAAIGPVILPLVGLGFLSVLTLYLPLLAWRLPRSRRPLMTCVLVGIVAAPGPVGYVFGAIGLLLAGELWFVPGILILTAPLGAIGGFTFWLCAIWEGRRAGVAGEAD